MGGGGGSECWGAHDDDTGALFLARRVGPRRRLASLGGDVRPLIWQWAVPALQLPRARRGTPSAARGLLLVSVVIHTHATASARPRPLARAVALSSPCLLRRSASAGAAYDARAEGCGAGRRPGTRRRRAAARAPGSLAARLPKPGGGPPSTAFGRVVPRELSRATGGGQRVTGMCVAHSVERRVSSVSYGVVVVATGATGRSRAAGGGGGGVARHGKGPLQRCHRPHQRARISASFSRNS